MKNVWNLFAPVLMTSVITDHDLCALERQMIMKMLGKGEWRIFGAHGMKKDIIV